MTFEQAAEALGRPVNTVLSWMARLRKKLKDRAEASERVTKLGAALRSSRPPPPEE
jgi:DNA-directed RNA polymerase specialized sigma24 family protein